jgi:O-antigen ligase
MGKMTETHPDYQQAAALKPPLHLQKASDWHLLCGRLGFFMFSFCLLLSTSAATLGLSLMVLAFICHFPRSWMTARKDPILRLGLLFLAYLVFHLTRVVKGSPAPMAEQLDASWAWLSLWGFVFVSWWTENRPDRMNKALGLSFSGFLIRIAYDLAFEFSTADLALFFQGIRTGLHYSINAAGLYTATAVWGLILALPGLFHIKSPAVLREGGGLIWLTGMGVMLNFCLITQSLSALISLAAVSCVMLPLWLWLKKPARISRISKRALAACFFLALVLGAAGFFYGKTIIGRALVESGTVLSVLTGRSQLPEDSSLALRLDMWQLGWQKFREKPVFGWGPGTSVIQRCAQGQDLERIRGYTHLHNTYLVILVRLGLIGALFYVAGGYFFIRSLFRSFRRRLMPEPQLLFFSGALFLIALSGMASFHVTDVDYRFFCLLLAGLAYSPHYYPRKNL